MPAPIEQLLDSLNCALTESKTEGASQAIRIARGDGQ